MNIERIIELQAAYHVTKYQELINSGQIWSFEGSMGRFAMDCLKAGICFLPEQRSTDYYGNTMPSRNDVKAGSTGSLDLAFEFWQRVEDMDFEATDYLEETFGTPEDVINGTMFKAIE